MKICRQLIAFFLLIGILLNCFNYWVLSSSYAFNKTYISTVLCSNRNKPDLHCEGKCFMDIKLKELEQKNKHDQENLKRLIETVAPTTALLKIPVFEVVDGDFTTHYRSQKPIKAIISIFQPPKIA